MHRKRRRLFAAILALILALLLVLPLFLQAVQGAQPQGDVTTDDTETVSGDSAGSSEEEEAGTDQPAAVPAAAGSGAARVTDVGKIYIENVLVSGMTKNEMIEAVNDKFRELSASPVVLYAGDRELDVTAGELGLSYTNPGIFDQIMTIGQKGNILKRFETERYLQEEGSIVFELDLAVNRDTVKNVLEDHWTYLNVDPVDSDLKQNPDETFTVIPCVNGVAVNESASVTAVENYMNEVWHGGEGGVNLNYTVTEARDETEGLSQVGDIIGIGLTDFSTSADSRIANIENACKKINGTLLYPGEEFSTLEALTPISGENGYQKAHAYEMGTVVESYGGGVCQVSSTLYHAVMAAELEVTERYPHTLTVDYVDPAYDAAIAEPRKDFKFRNNQDYPVFIQGVIYPNKTIEFRIYGKEVRPSSRNVTYESRTISTTPKEETVWQTDATLAFGYITFSKGHEGVVAELWKTVTENGTSTEEKINSSIYMKSDDTYSVGTKGATAGKIREIDNVIDRHSMDIMKVVVGQKELLSEDQWNELFYGG